MRLGSVNYKTKGKVARPIRYLRESYGFTPTGGETPVV